MLLWSHPWRSAGKNGPVTSHLSGSLKVTGTNTDQSATYNFLLATVTTGLSCTVSKINGDWSKIANFSRPPGYLMSLLRGFLLKLCNGGGVKKEWCPYQIVKMCDDMYTCLNSRILLLYTIPALDTWMDRPEMAKQYRARHASGHWHTKKGRLQGRFVDAKYSTHVVSMQLKWFWHCLDLIELFNYLPTHFQ